jgi:S-adenosyl-L-methionine methyltransferase
MAGDLTPSSLDLMIARLTTQRRLLEEAMSMIAGVDGVLLEVGLGKGRTYDHLRHLMPHRKIYVYDRDLHAPPDATPQLEHLFLGDFVDTLAAAAANGRIAAFAHADFGSSNRTHDALLAKALGPLLQRLVRIGGIVMSDRELAADGWTALPIDPRPSWPYFMWRVDA